MSFYDVKNAVTRNVKKAKDKVEAGLIKKEDIDHVLCLTDDIIEYYNACLNSSGKRKKVEVPENVEKFFKYLENQDDSTLSYNEKKYYAKCCDVMSIDAKAYKTMLAKRQVAVSIATQAGAGIIGLGGSMTAIGGIASLTMGASMFGASIFPPLLLATAPVAIAAYIAPAAFSPVVRYLKEKEGSIKERISKIEELQKQIVEKSTGIREKYNSNAIKISKKINEIGEEYRKKSQILSDELNDFLKKAMITADDALHTDVNKRIQRYQKIALKQYEIQIEHEKKYEELVKLYSDVLKENEKLKQENAELQKMIEESALFKQSMEGLKSRANSKEDK